MVLFTIDPISVPEPRKKWGATMARDEDGVLQELSRAVFPPHMQS